MRMQPQAELARELGGLAHQFLRHRERRARRDRDLDLCAVCERRRRLGRREHVVSVLDDRVGRKAAVGFAQVPRAARRDDAHAELARRPDLRLEQSLPAGREEVVVVEDGRAAGKRQLGEAAARGRVLRLLVDPRPHRVQRLEPAEQVLVLRAGPREVLPEVMVGVDQPRRDDGAAEVDDLIGVGPHSCAGLLHEAVVDEQPAAGMLVALVVHRHEVRVDEEGAHTRSGTISKRSTSTRPRSVIFRLGITDKPRNDSVRNGVAPDQPRARAASLHSRLSRITSASRASASSPATGSGSSAFTSPPSTTTMPPPSSAMRVTACTMSSSLLPMTMMLCASCETVDASAPRCSPERATKPSPIRPVPRWRSTTAIFASSSFGFSSSNSVTTWSGTRPITRTLPAPASMRKSSAVTGWLRTECLTHSGTSGSGISPTGRPDLSVSSGSKRSRSPSTSKSAW